MWGSEKVGAPEALEMLDAAFDEFGVNFIVSFALGVSLGSVRRGFTGGCCSCGARARVSFGRLFRTRRSFIRCQRTRVPTAPLTK